MYYNKTKLFFIKYYNLNLKKNKNQTKNLKSYENMYDKNYRMYKHTYTYWHSNALKGHEKKKIKQNF